MVNKKQDPMRNERKKEGEKSATNDKRTKTHEATSDDS